MNNNVLPSAPVDDLPMLESLRIYETHNAVAKALYERELDHIPIGRRPRWESQPLEARVSWLNRAAKELKRPPT